MVCQRRCKVGLPCITFILEESLMMRALGKSMPKYYAERKKSSVGKHSRHCYLQRSAQGLPVCQRCGGHCHGMHETGMSSQEPKSRKVQARKATAHHVAVCRGLRFLNSGG